MEIKGFLETSLLDWDGKIASVLFLPGCNFRCGYCHNDVLAHSPEELESVEWEHIEKRLKTRRDWIDGVVVSGGEPLIHADLEELLRAIKSLGFPVKLDTNGSYPERLRQLINDGWVDYVAMDVKAPLDERYDVAAGTHVDVGALRETIAELRESGVPYELRTTLVPTLTGEPELEEIARSIQGARTFVLQQFVPRQAARDPWRSLSPYSSAQVDRFLDIVRPQVGEVRFRGK